MQRLLMIVVASLLFSSNAFPQEGVKDKTCGDPVDGIALCLSRAADNDNLVVVFVNVGPADLVLNLGIALVFREYYPNALTLVLDDSTGNSTIKLAGPAYVAGRVDPFVVPLPSGASFKFPIRLADRRTTDTSVSTYIVKLNGRQTVRAQFDGKAVNLDDTNSDVKGIAFKPYWIGSVRSNPLVLNPEN